MTELDGDGCWGFHPYSLGCPAATKRNDELYSNAAALSSSQPTFSFKPDVKATFSFLILDIMFRVPTPTKSFPVIFFQFSLPMPKYQAQCLGNNLQFWLLRHLTIRISRQVFCISTFGTVRSTISIGRFESFHVWELRRRTRPLNVLDLWLTVFRDRRIARLVISFRFFRGWDAYLDLSTGLV